MEIFEKRKEIQPRIVIIEKNRRKCSGRWQKRGGGVGVE
jgi:hypothetical protein